MFAIVSAWQFACQRFDFTDTFWQPLRIAQHRPRFGFELCMPLRPRRPLPSNGSCGCAHSAWPVGGGWRLVWPLKNGAHLADRSLMIGHFSYRQNKAHVPGGGGRSVGGLLKKLPSKNFAQKCLCNGRLTMHRGLSSRLFYDHTCEKS